MTNTAKVLIFGSQQGQQMMNTFYVDNTDPWDEPGLLDLLDQITGWYNDSAPFSPGLKPLMSSELTIVGGRAYDAPESPTIETSVSVSVTGTNTSGGLPTGCTVAIKRQSGLTGRSNRGRVFFMGLPKDALVSGTEDQVTSSFAASVVAAFEKLRTELTVHNAAWTMSIWSRALSASVPCTQWVLVDPYVDSQRRRLIGHNRHR